MMMVMVSEQVFYIVVFLIGAVFGSFAGAQVWRCRARQLDEDDRNGEKVTDAEFKKLKPLLNKKFKQDRSICLSCKHELAWYDMIPVLSWMFMWGRCRYCHKFIGWSEIILEISLGTLFLLSFIMWPGDTSQPLEWLKIILWLAALVTLTINFVYDLKWSLLVTKLNWLLVSLGVIFAIVSIYQSPDWASTLGSVVLAVLILGGLYGLLWLISAGRWVGEGDAYLGAGIALFLIDWKLAFLALFAANLVGTLVLLPSMLTGKLQKGSQVPFGPMLIIGGLIAWFIGSMIIDWYQTLVFLA